MLQNETYNELRQSRTEFLVSDRLSPNFSRNEFRCKGGDDCCGGSAAVDSRLIAALEELRSIIKQPIKILSGFRCVSYNKKCGGAIRSQHCNGTAADIIVGGMITTELAQIAESIPALQNGGIGTYDRGWVHIDVRHGRARWHSK